MTYSVTGSPIEAFADAVLTALNDDSTYKDLSSGGVYASLPRATRTAVPYTVLGRRQLLGGGGAMQVDGGTVAAWLDVWSEQNSPHEVQTILSRARAVLQRAPLRVAGYTLIAGSLTCEEELVIPDFDPDAPERSLYHGIQKWTADVEEAS